MAIVIDGTAVSVCFSARSTTAASEAGVETLPEHRGRRHAGAVTAAWAAQVRRQGRIPLYSTSWTNHPSRRVAARMSLSTIRHRLPHHLGAGDRCRVESGLRTEILAARAARDERYATGAEPGSQEFLYVFGG